MIEKRERRKIKVKAVDDVTQFGDITNDRLLVDSERYDKDNYNPLGNLEDKEILVPSNKTEVITIRVSDAENQLINKFAHDMGISKSSYIRSIIKNSLCEPNKNSFPQNCNLDSVELDKVNNKLESLENRIAKIEEIDLKLSNLIVSIKQQTLAQK